MCVGVVFYMLCSDNRNMHSIGQVRTLVSVSVKHSVIVQGPEHTVSARASTKAEGRACVYDRGHLLCVFAFVCMCVCLPKCAHGRRSGLFKVLTLFMLLSVARLPPLLST